MNLQGVTVARALRFAARYVSGYFAKGRFAPRGLPKLSIETTNICNSDCVFCANSVMKRKKGTIDMQQFVKAVDEYAAAGGDLIDFTVSIGDPLLDKKLMERARYVRSYEQFKSLGFVTTLQWLHKHDIDEFIRVFTWVGVSTTLSGKETYKRFFGVDKYDVMLINLKALLAKVKESGSSFFVGVNLKPTDEPKEAILRHPDFIEINRLVGGGLEEQVENRSFFVDDWQGAVKLPAYLQKRPLYPRMFRPCLMLYNNLMIHSNGKVSACSCRDYEADSDLIIGTVAQASVADMWRGEKMRHLRSDWRYRNKVPNICKDCRHYLY